MSYNVWCQCTRICKFIILEFSDKKKVIMINWSKIYNLDVTNTSLSDKTQWYEPKLCINKTSDKNMVCNNRCLNNIVWSQLLSTIKLTNLVTLSMQSIII